MITYDTNFTWLTDIRLCGIIIDATELGLACPTAQIGLLLHNNHSRRRTNRIVKQSECVLTSAVTDHGDGAGADRTRQKHICHI